jgi:hypothetical protein
MTEVLAGRRTTASAATVLVVSVRQTERLLIRYRDGGGALIHKARGRTSNYQLSTAIRDYALELIRQSYRDFGPTPAAEILLERHGLQVSRETLRRAEHRDPVCELQPGQGAAWNGPTGLRGTAW